MKLTGLWHSRVAFYSERISWKVTLSLFFLWYYFHFWKQDRKFIGPEFSCFRVMQKVGRKWDAKNCFLSCLTPKQYRLAKPECVSASNSLCDPYLLCYCWAFTLVIVDHRESWQLNLKWMRSVLREWSAKIHFFLDIVALKMCSLYWEALA